MDEGKRRVWQAVAEKRADCGVDAGAWDECGAGGAGGGSELAPGVSVASSVSRRRIGGSR